MVLFTKKIAMQVGDDEQIINYEWPKANWCIFIKNSLNYKQKSVESLSKNGKGIKYLWNHYMTAAYW